MTRKINQDGKKLIKQWEALILYAYDDFDTKTKKTFIQKGMTVRGTLTIGYGHTGPDVKPGMKITQEQAEQLLDKDLAPAEQAVSTLVKVELNDNQFAALVSFVFNVGVGNFKSSTLLKKLNSGNYNAVPTELAKWINSKGKKMQGLVNRRAAEAGLWAKGSYVQSAGSPVTKEKEPVVTLKNASIATTLLSSVGSGWFEGTGPVQYAIASLAVLAGATAIGIFLYERYKR